MKTKNIIKNSLLCFGLLGFASCSLDTESVTDLNDQTAFGNQAAAQMALTGCYDGWQATVSSEGVGMYLTAELASEQAHGGLGFADAKNNNAIDQFDLSIAPSYNNLFDGDWKNYYYAIGRCNNLIAHENITKWDNEAGKGLVIGQARAIRAILYFDLTRLFGDVPLVVDMKKETKPRTPATEVYKQIFEDLKWAAANIPADAYPVSAGNADGHVTKYAAEALLARVYLYYTGYYGKEHESCTKQEAIDALEDIIDHGGYELEKNYADLFMPACTEDAQAGTTADTRAWKTTYKGKYYSAGEWHSDMSKEIILNLKFGATGDYSGNADGNSFCVYLGPRNKSVNNKLIASGWGACSVTKAFVDEFKDDPRFNTCVWSCKDADFEADVKDTYEYTGYYTRKYAPMCFADGTRQEVGFNLGIAHQNLTYYQDWTIMRYADVLLMHSELTETSKGLSMVHQRAYGQGQTIDYSVENLRKERAIEFAFEGVHYWDIMRYEKDGEYAARAIDAAQNGAKVQNGGMDAVVTFDIKNFEAKKGLMQIPNTQITLSGNVLTQNQGW